MELIAQRQERGEEVDSSLESLPDWIAYLNIAESLGCPPWEMFEPEETPPPKAWWREARMILDSARSEARRQQDQMRT